MAEYIEREALKPLEEMEYIYFMSPAAVPYYEAHKVWEVLDNIPAADVAPVRQWISVEERLPLVGCASTEVFLLSEKSQQER